MKGDKERGYISGLESEKIRRAPSDIAMMTTTYTVTMDLTGEQARALKLMVKQLDEGAKFSKARAAVTKAAGEGKKPSVKDLPMNKPVYLTEQADKAKAGTAFADRKKHVYTKHEGETIEEMLKKKITYESKSKTCHFGKKDLLMDYTKAKPFIRFGEEEATSMDEESESEGEGEEECDF